MFATVSFSRSVVGMKSLSARLWGRQCLACLALLQAWISATQGHPNHDVIAEADWNAKTASLEVALQVNAHELERAVSIAAGEALDLDEESSVHHLKKYIATKVRCLKADGAAIEMLWVGAEIKVRSAWVYFEFPVGTEVAVADCSISNTVLFDQHEDQKNTVALRLSPKEPRRFLRFSKDQAIVKLGQKEDGSKSTKTAAAQ